MSRLAQHIFLWKTKHSISTHLQIRNSQGSKIVKSFLAELVMNGWNYGWNLYSEQFGRFAENSCQKNLLLCRFKKVTNLYDLLKFFGKTTAVICLGAGNKPTINYYIFLQIFKIRFYRLWSFSHWKNDRVDKKGALDNFFTFGLGIWNKKSLDLIWFMKKFELKTKLSYRQFHLFQSIFLFYSPI